VFITVRLRTKLRRAKGLRALVPDDTNEFYGSDNVTPRLAMVFDAFTFQSESWSAGAAAVEAL
jgi:hypothetical protein